MFRFLKATGLALTILATAMSAKGFALLGLPDTWQATGIGYQLVGNDWNADIGGPMNLGEEYRWNVPVITYGFDSSFVTYYGKRGMDEVRKAVAIINNLPAMSKVSSDLHEFSTDTRRQNYRAQSLLIFDLKSTSLAFLVNALGLASPERYVFTIEARIPLVGGGNEYHIIMRNFDPRTLFPSAYVNDILYTWRIGPVFPMFPNSQSVGNVDLTLTTPLDPNAPAYTTVASALDSQLTLPLSVGDFYTGLTRDDVGGLRYLYAGKGPYANYNLEGLNPNVTTNSTTGSGSAWGAIGSGSAITVALRPGVDKVKLKEVKFDSTLGAFITVTNSFTDTYITNGNRVTQRLQVQITQPDILFAAEDQDVFLLTRQFGAGNLVNNAQIDGVARPGAGPGIIQTIPATARIVLVFNKIGPTFINTDFPTGPDVTDQQNAVTNFVWGSFDGTTNEPFIYPVGPGGQPAITAEEREHQMNHGH
jgi:hypothetical protein